VWWRWRDILVGRNILVWEKDLYCICCHKIEFDCKGEQKMNCHLGNEDIRWQVVKAMMDEFPALKNKIKEYIEEPEN
jgi:hypothetical protein